MKKKQLAKLGVALGLTAAVGVGGTLALMTAHATEVTNTFTVGNALMQGDITLDEAEMQNSKKSGDKYVVNRTVKEDGDSTEGYEYDKKVDGIRVNQNEYQGLQAGDDIYKDPTVHIEQGTANCYVFIDVTGLDKLSTKGLTVDVENNLLLGGVTETYNYTWKPVESSVEAGKDGTYYLANADGTPIVVNSSSAKMNYLVFESLNAGTVNQLYNDDGSAKITASDNITVKACAVQATGASFEEAKDELPGAFTDTTVTE